MDIRLRFLNLCEGNGETEKVSCADKWISVEAKQEVCRQIHTQIQSVKGRKLEIAFETV